MISTLPLLPKNIMKKKLSKVELEERKRRLNRAFHIFAYVSFAFNILFVVLMAFSGCAAKPSYVNNHSFASHKQERQESNISRLVDFPLHSANGYDFRNLKSPQNITFSIVDNFYIALGGNYQVLVQTANSTYVGLNSDVHVNVNIHSPVVEGDYFKINWGANQYENYYEIDSLGRWVNAGVNNINEVYLSTFSHNDDQLDLNKFFYILDNLVEPCVYYDFDWFGKWSPYSFYGRSFLLPYLPSTSIDQDTLVDDVLFSSAGQLWTSIIVDFSNTGARVCDSNGNNVRILENQKFINFVMFKNNFTNKTLIVMSNDMRVDSEGNGATVVDTLNYLDSSYSQIRLFNRNVGVNSDVNSSITNYTVFASSFEGFANGLSNEGGTFGNVFGLAQTAFSGVFSMLAVEILPGITLGLLFVLPLVGVILFAVIKLLRQ